MTCRDDRLPSPDGDSTAAATPQVKSTARDLARAARDRLDGPAMQSASADACLNLLELPELAHVSAILAYAALPAEIDPLGAVTALRLRGVAVAYPRIESTGVLATHFIEDERALVPGPFGLSEPPNDAPPAALHLFDAVIVPGVAFDQRGTRLGYGGGYYDRLLPQLRPDCLRLGLAFDHQILAELPAEAHDAAVDLIVTPSRVIRPADRRPS